MTQPQTGKQLTIKLMNVLYRLELMSKQDHRRLTLIFLFIHPTL